MASTRRPSRLINSCTVYSLGANGNWEPKTFSINDWVTMLPSCRGSHKVKRKKRDDIKHHWKGRIIAFKIMPEGWFVNVQHVYMSKDMHLPPNERVPQQTHYIFPSTSNEWQPVESLSGTFHAIHKALADIYADQTVCFPSECRVFRYYAQYVVPSTADMYGYIEELPLPSISSLNWEIPDKATVQSFKLKICQDIQKSMTGGRISRRIRLSWFVPLHVFVACFKTANLQKTKVSWLCRNFLEEDLDNIVGTLWKSRECDHKGDIIRCSACPQSLALAYIIPRQTLALGFDYRRYKLRLGVWVPLDSDIDCTPLKIQVQVPPHEEAKEVNVTSNWSLKDVRDTLELLDNTSPGYRFKVDGMTIGKRAERSFSCMSCLSPTTMSFEP